MNADNSLKNWQVEDGGKGAERYALTGSETDPPKQLQLQEDATGGSQWQPIDYRRQTGPRRNWILPSVIVVALLGVMAYVGWIAFGQVAGGSGGANPFEAMYAVVSSAIGGQTATAPTPATVAAGVPVTATVTTAAEQPTTAPTTAVTEVTATLEPPATPTPEPTPTPAQVELVTGTVIEAAGANARREPSTTAEILRLLPQNAAVTVVAEQDTWLQVILDDNTVAWVSADLVERKSELVLLARLNEVLAAAGLPPVTPAAPADVTAAAPAAPGAAPRVKLPAVVIGEPGINARNAPDLAGGVTLMTLNKDTAVTAVGRTDTSQWLAVELPEGDYGWVMTQFVSTAGDVATLDVVTPEVLATWVAAAAIAAAPAVSETAPSLLQAPTPTAAAAPTSAPALPVLAISLATPPAPFTNTLPLGPAVAISNALGVNARATPAADGALLLVVPDGAVLPATGRSADDEWIQVRLPDGQLAWMARAVLNVSDNIDTAPVGGVTAEAAAPALAASATVTASTEVTPTAVAPTTPVLTSAGQATITNPLGANLRSVPDRNTNPVVTVKSGERFPVLGRTADAAWVQLALPDGTTGWALVTTVSLDTDVNNLPIIP